MDSCLVFVYNNESSLTYIKNLINERNLILSKKHKLNDTTLIESDSKNDISTPRNELNKNVHVIKSEICGLGKTTKIYKDIKEIKKKEYIHFPIGGNISRNILYKKLEKILDKIEKIINEKYSNEKERNCYKFFAIHLDLYDNNETSILNEFLFSFLITKFYSNNENIIYIPKDIEIFVEVPNCFEDFMSKYKILNSFDIENIQLEKKPELNLDDEKLIHFGNMLGTKDNHLISDFINKNIGIDQYSYHQANIFINLFISQYSKTQSKRYFYGDDSKDITDLVIKNFAECTKYFTSGAFSNLLTNKDTINEINGKNKLYMKLLSQTYDNDLKHQKYPHPLIVRNLKENGEVIIKNLYVSKEKLSEELRIYKAKEENKNKEDSYYYLEKLKDVLNLETDIETLKQIIDKDEYIITDNNFRKMILILYRIVANIPVILMGETGCGKTRLIRKLNQLINNGEEKLETINMHPC